jgi:hypothetical protein
MLIALLAWLLPIFVMITPSTLIVTSRVLNKIMLSTAPAVDLADYPRWARMHATGNYSSCLIEYYQGGACNSTRTLNDTKMMLYESPSPQIAIHVVAGVTSGKVESMTPEFSNSTFWVSFYGPSIHCRNATERLEEFRTTLGASGELWYQAFIPVINKTVQTIVLEPNGTRRLGHSLELWMVTKF